MQCPNCAAKEDGEPIPELMDDSPKLGFSVYECPVCEAGYEQLWEGPLVRVGGEPPVRPAFLPENEKGKRDDT